MLSPEDTAAIGLIVLAIVQAAKLLRMPAEWAPVLAVALGGAIGVAAGLSNDLPPETWLSMVYSGAVGGLTGAGLYGTVKGMGEMAENRRRATAAKARAAKPATRPKPKREGIA